VKLTTEYARLDVSDDGSSSGSSDNSRYWATRVLVEPDASAAAAAAASYDEDEDEEDEDGAAGAAAEQYPAAVYFYVAIDCDGSVPPHMCLDAAGAGTGGLSLQIDRNPGLAAGACVVCLRG
jgi:hypothetical protein